MHMLKIKNMKINLRVLKRLPNSFFFSNFEISFSHFELEVPIFRKSLRVKNVVWGVTATAWNTHHTITWLKKKDAIKPYIWIGMRAAKITYVVVAIVGWFWLLPIICDDNIFFLDYFFFDNLELLYKKWITAYFSEIIVRYCSSVR